MNLVIHGFSATFMYNNDFDRQLSHLELQKKSLDIVFKFETASWWQLLLTLIYGTWGAKPEHPSPFLSAPADPEEALWRYSSRAEDPAFIHFCWLKAKREVKFIQASQDTPVNCTADVMPHHGILHHMKKVPTGRKKKKSSVHTKLPAGSLGRQQCLPKNTGSHLHSQFATLLVIMNTSWGEREQPKCRAS